MAPTILPNNKRKRDYRPVLHALARLLDNSGVFSLSRALRGLASSWFALHAGSSRRHFSWSEKWLVRTPQQCAGFSLRVIPSAPIAKIIPCALANCRPHPLHRGFDSLNVT
jgi:hypothetical protein